MKRLLAIIMIGLFLTVGCSFNKTLPPTPQVEQVQPIKVEILPVFKEAKEKALKGNIHSPSLRGVCKETNEEKKCLFINVEGNMIILTKAEGPLLLGLVFDERTGIYGIVVFFEEQMTEGFEITQEEANTFGIRMMQEFENFTTIML